MLRENTQMACQVIKLADMFDQRNFSISENSDNEHIRKKEESWELAGSQAYVLRD